MAESRELPRWGFAHSGAKFEVGVKPPKPLITLDTAIMMKTRISLPDWPSLADLAANDNAAIGVVVALARGMPAADQAAVRALLGAGPARVEGRAPPDLEAAILAQPFEAVQDLGRRVFSPSVPLRRRLADRDPALLTEHLVEPESVLETINFGENEL